MKNSLILFLWFFGACTFTPAKGQQVSQLSKEIAADLSPVYRHLHQNPELSLQEKNTSNYLQELMTGYGYEIAGPFGGYGFAAILYNGPGPVVMIRADMDALPVLEETGIPYASTVTVNDQKGQSIPVMHACGHDMHMACWLGTARFMSRKIDQWQGTLVFLAQPAEEFGDGARNMLNDGLFDKIPIPDYALALHVSPNLPAGSIGYSPGYAYANVDAMDIIVYGKGGHGAYPHTTTDPVILSSRIIMGLQTLVSREFSPLEPLVITVGAIDGGTKGNIIPDQVHLQMTIRYHNEALRPLIIQSIKRLCDGLAQGAGLTPDQYPKLQYYPENLPGVYNDPPLTGFLAKVWSDSLGPGQVKLQPATLGGEDFGRFGNTVEDIPICIYWLGSAGPEHFQTMENGENAPLYSLHSSRFLPLEQTTMETGIRSMSAAVMSLLQNSGKIKDLGSAIER